MAKPRAIWLETGYRFGFADYSDFIDYSTTRKEAMLRNSILSLSMIGALAAAMFNSPNIEENARSSELIQAPTVTLAQAPAEVKTEAKSAEKASGESVLEKPAEASKELAAEEKHSDQSNSEHAEHEESHDHADHDHSDHEHADDQEHSHNHDGDVVIAESPSDYAIPSVVAETPCCSCYTVCEARTVRVGLFKLRCKTCMVPVTVCDSCPIHATAAAPVYYESEMSYAEPMTETVIESETLPAPVLEEAPVEEPTPAKPVEAAEAVEAETQEA